MRDGYPPICGTCKREIKRRKDGCYHRWGGNCDTCTRRQRRIDARNAAPPEPEPEPRLPLKASDSGYGAYGTARLDVAS
jgi:hypothetical protein